jgi:SAM-dependent methyltransferase
MVKRMLSIGMGFPLYVTEGLPVPIVDLLIKIDNIGYKENIPLISGDCSRMIYYARQILEKNPPSIVEIGGGVGQFYAVLRALGYRGKYCIIDLSAVEHFQQLYLNEVSKQTGLIFPMELRFDFCVSFYALGEFDDETKNWYIEKIVSRCPHGFIIWNPHSGASADINFPFRHVVKDEYPLLAEGNKQIEW